MDCRKVALLVCVAANCAGCVTETTQMTMSSESVAKLKNVKEVAYPKREATPLTWVAIGRMQEAKAADVKVSSIEKNQWRDEARKAYQKAIELDGACVDAHIALANLHVKQDDYARALDVYQHACNVIPKSAALWYEQGVVQLHRRDLAAAQQCFSKAHELDPQNRHVGTQYGLCLARAGNHQQALAVLCRVMNTAEANYTVARMMQQVDQPELSRRYVQAALQERPTHGGSLQLLAFLNNPNSAPAPALAQTPTILDANLNQAAFRKP